MRRRCLWRGGGCAMMVRGGLWGECRERRNKVVGVLCRKMRNLGCGFLDWRRRRAHLLFGGLRGGRVGGRGGKDALLGWKRDRRRNCRL